MNSPWCVIHVHGLVVASLTTQLTLYYFFWIFMSDSDLEFISKYCVSLVYLNLKGCISVTDVCVSNLIRRCIKLHSIIVCDTYFGVNSVRALCSEFPDGNSSASHGKRHFDSLASNLQTLHMSCCHGEYYFLFSLSLQTNLLGWNFKIWIVSGDLLWC